MPDKDRSKDTTGFSVTTNTRTFYFRADSPQSATEWVKQLQKIIFRSRNDGDSVKISIPTDNVLEIEENPLQDFADTIKIKVIDNDETFAVDEYFFSFFGSGEQALKDLRIMTQDTSAKTALTGTQTPTSAVRQGRAYESSGKASTKPSATGILHESVRTALSPSAAHRVSSRTKSTRGEANESRLDTEEAQFSHHQSNQGRDRSTSPSRHSNLTDAGTRYESSPMSPQYSSLSESLATLSEGTTQSDSMQSINDSDASGSQILSGSVMFHDPTIREQMESKGSKSGAEESSSKHSHDKASARDRPVTKTSVDSTSSAGSKISQQSGASSAATTGRSSQDAPRLQHADSSSALGGLMRASAIPIQRATSYLKGPTKTVASLLHTSPMEVYGKVTGMIAGEHRHYGDVDGLSPDDHVRDADDEIDVQQAERRFREHFALPESERLVATYYAFLHRVLPFYGKIYVGTTRLCYRSLMLGTRTKVCSCVSTDMSTSTDSVQLVIPFKDILKVDKEKGFRLGYQGMVVIIRGHEEIFFEFGKQAHRDDCTITILRALLPITSGKESGFSTEGVHRNAKAAAAENLLLKVARGEDDTERVNTVPRNIYQSGPSDIEFYCSANSTLC